MRGEFLAGTTGRAPAGNSVNKKIKKDNRNDPKSARLSFYLREGATVAGSPYDIVIHDFAGFVKSKSKNF